MRSTLLNKGFSIQTDVVIKPDSEPRKILRSFVNSPASAATEQTNYHAAIDANGLSGGVSEQERRPILQLRWDSQNEKLLSPLAALDYRGQRYRTTNPASAPTPESASRNRDVFRLVVELASQNTIDTSKYPLPTNLQVLPSP